MSFSPYQRLEFFLAKVAGEDVDISTLVPPVATNAIEQALLSIAENSAKEDAAVEELKKTSGIIVDVYVIGTFADPTSVVSGTKVSDIVNAAKSGKDVTVIVYSVADVDGDDVVAAAAASESKVAVCASKLVSCDISGKVAYFYPLGYSSGDITYGITGTHGSSSDTWVVDASLAPAG